MTRREPVWRTDDFTPEVGRAAVALVEERVRRGLPPASVVSVTGLALREQEREAERLGAYERHPMFDARSSPTACRCRTARVRAGRRDPVGDRLPAGGRPPRRRCTCARAHGGIQLDGTTAVADPRVQLVGYGPSASTIGANRAGRVAARGVADWLRPGRSGAEDGLQRLTVGQVVRLDGLPVRT